MSGLGQSHFIHMWAGNATFFCPCITILRPVLNRIIVKFTWFQNGNEEGLPAFRIRWDNSQTDFGLIYCNSSDEIKKSVVEFCEQMIGFGFKEFGDVIKRVKEL